MAREGRGCGLVAGRGDEDPCCEKVMTSLVIDYGWLTGLCCRRQLVAVAAVGGCGIKPGRVRSMENNDSFGERRESRCKPEDDNADLTK